MRPQDLYRDVVHYLRESGWEREEKGSGWWWIEQLGLPSELVLMGEALDQQLLHDGIDLRAEPS